MARKFEPIYKKLEGRWSEYSISRAIEWLTEGSDRALSVGEVRDCLMRNIPRLDRACTPAPTPQSELERREAVEIAAFKAKIERVVCEKIANGPTWRKTHAAKIARVKAWKRRIEASVENGTIRFD